MPKDRQLPGTASMMFCSLFAVALTACGGGSSGSATASAATAASSDVAAAASADSASGVASAAPTTDGTSGAVATDAGGGAGSDGSATAAAGVLSVKAATTVLTVPIAAEGQSFLVPGTMAVRYGVGSSWVTKNVTGSGTCSAAFFGAGAANGVFRSCEVQVTVAVSASGGSTAATAGLPGAEGDTFYVFGSRAVQFGANGKFVTKTVVGRGSCTNDFFGSDPAWGVVKSCAVAPAGSAAAMVASLMPAVETSKIAAAVAGYSTARVMAANVADPSQNPGPSDIGAFREYCEYSHMSYADPIAAPGGASAHLHTFLGNTGTNANSTAASIAGSGNSTCAGGILNRTSYWVPTVIDMADGTPQKPIGSLIYYKQGYNYIASTAIRAFPAGLRMVAGSAASSGPQDNTGFTCSRTDGTWTTSKSIPTDCPAGATLTAVVAFPQCWDGVNLDSPDHKSHMAYPGNGCPATHPVALTGVTFNINYRVGASGTSHWRLSSDNYDSTLPGGYSNHADWFYGWNPDILSVWTTRCINASMDCHAFLIGDGRILY